ncbi:hypothetical protein PSTG_10040 [Puccinia striiformis f. sp. tritici PST-78]|uniref:Uncharacterized protein n=1 Tax=Puccinia striiformis f. sp. tritici PST-78 TaxID=1165861 RepID=A0A0L0VBJ1_9BASI|nr:hypothetical protein PSTG_10040 [Puccinia striiformis f. sp. tritici PST-78]
MSSGSSPSTRSGASQACLGPWTACTGAGKTVQPLGKGNTKARKRRLPLYWRR